jgi:hypothetical protein
MDPEADVQLRTSASTNTLLYLYLIQIASRMTLHLMSQQPEWRKQPQRFLNLPTSPPPPPIDLSLIITVSIYVML